MYESEKLESGTFALIEPRLGTKEVNEEKELTLRLAEQISGESPDSVSDTYDVLEASRFHIMVETRPTAGRSAVRGGQLRSGGRRLFRLAIRSGCKGHGVKLLVEKLKAFLTKKNPCLRRN